MTGVDMGQAKQKREKLATMNDGEKVRMCAKNLFERHMLPNGHRGACYFLTFLLHHHLAKRHKVMTQPVIGFVNDGTDKIWGSHAWLMFEGKKTDLAIHLPMHPEVSPFGHAQILDEIVRRGEADYLYALEVPSDGATDQELIAAFKDAERRAEFEQIAAHKQQEHQMMKEIAGGSLEMLFAYLNAAPGPPYSYYEKVMG